MGVIASFKSGDGRSVDVTYDNDTLEIETIEVVNTSGKFIHIKIIDTNNGSWVFDSTSQGSFPVDPGFILISVDSEVILNLTTIIRCDMEN